MKHSLAFVTAALLAFCLLTGCAGSGTPAGKTYKYEGAGFGGDFTIELQENGRFEYDAGGFSSYIGMGNWSISGDILTLTDDQIDFVNHFRMERNCLVFQEDGSTNFMYVKVGDGEKFTAVIFE